MRRLTIFMASVLVLAAAGRIQRQTVIDKDTTIDYTTEEDMHIVEGADPPTVGYREMRLAGLENLPVLPYLD